MSSPRDMDTSEQGGQEAALDYRRLEAELSMVKVSVEAMRDELNRFIAQQPKDRDLCAAALAIAAECTAVSAQSNSIAQAAISLAGKTHNGGGQ